MEENNNTNTLEENENKNTDPVEKTPLEKYEGEPFLLLQSELVHDVSKVLDKKKGLSLFKFGRTKTTKPFGKEKTVTLPTRVPEEFGKALLESRPEKYKIVEIPEKVSDLEEYFAELIEFQDDHDNAEEQRELEERIAADRKRLEELEKLGKAKKVVRE